jgi:hypothetical protein
MKSESLKNSLEGLEKEQLFDFIHLIINYLIEEADVDWLINQGLVESKELYKGKISSKLICEKIKVSQPMFSALVSIGKASLSKEKREKIKNRFTKRKLIEIYSNIQQQFHLFYNIDKQGFEFKNANLSPSKNNPSKHDEDEFSYKNLPEYFENTFWYAYSMDRRNKGIYRDILHIQSVDNKMNVKLFFFPDEQENYIGNISLDESESQILIKLKGEETGLDYWAMLKYKKGISPSILVGQFISSTKNNSLIAGNLLLEKQINTTNTNTSLIEYNTPIFNSLHPNLRRFFARYSENVLASPSDVISTYNHLTLWFAELDKNPEYHIDERLRKYTGEYVLFFQKDKILKNWLKIYVDEIVSRVRAELEINGEKIENVEVSRNGYCLNLYFSKFIGYEKEIFFAEFLMKGDFLEGHLSFTQAGDYPQFTPAIVFRNLDEESIQNKLNIFFNIKN